MKLNKILTLTEAAVGARPQYDTLQIDEVITLLNTHCGDALWMIKNNNPIWRGFRDLDDSVPFYRVDPSKTVRKSQNTNNYYTMIWDHHPDWQGWPKRSRSLIATSDISYAGDYGNRFAVIPYDGAKIGAVNSNDLHDIDVDVGGYRASYPEINRALGRFWVPDTSYEELVQYVNGPDMQEYLDGANPLDLRGAIAKIITSAPTPMDGLNDLFSMSRMYPKPTLHTTKTLQSAPGWDETEVWVSGPCILITKDAFDEIGEKLSTE